MDKRVIFHIDVNNAFLSWTAVKMLKEGSKIDIRTIPSIIGGDENARKGVVIAKSPIAKKYGIKTAETIYSARKKCTQLKVYPANHSYYREISKALFTYLKKYSPTMEQISIDECFLDMSNMHYIYNDLEKLAYNIKEDIKIKFGFTVNIGIANNKLCAKMASDFEKPDKVHTLYDNEIKTKLWPLPVKDLYMVGKKSTEKLEKVGIKTIEDLANTDIKFLKRTFGISGELMLNYANGIDESTVNPSDKRNSKSISTSETLTADINDKSILKKILLKQTEHVCRQLRRQQVYATTVGITFKTYNFAKYSKQMKLNNPSNSTSYIYDSILKIFNDYYQGEKLRSIGVRITDFSSHLDQQISLFDKKIPPKDTISTILDDIKDKYGDDIIMPASLYTKE